MSELNPLGNWSELVRRLDAAGYADRWSTDPRLATLTSVAQLKTWTRPGDPKRSDEVLGALVAQAAAAGGDDAEAVLVVLHLLLPGAERIARKMRHLNHNALTLVLGELAIQVRRFPLERRTHAFAANLLMDSQNTVWRGELKPYRTDLGHRRAELLVDPIDDARGVDAEFGTSGLLEAPAAVADDFDLVDMLLWARRTGAVNAIDLAVLIELEYARDTPGVTSPQQHVADLHGCSIKSVQRYRDRALIALRDCSKAYLAAA